MIDEAESLYEWAMKLPWFKNKEFNPNPEDVDEGRFAKRLEALGEGRFAKQLASLEAMMECDESVKLNEGTKVTLTLKQLKKLVKEGDEVATNADIDYDDEDGQEPGIPQVVEPAIDDHLCEMIAEIANDYFDMDVDDYETRAIADEQLNSIYTSMRSLALKWLKAVKDSK